MKLLLLSFVIATSSASLNVHKLNYHDVYWNSSNPLFETFDNAIDSPGYYEMSAKPMDVIKFHCPKKRSKEFSIIYQVSQDDFMHCVLSANAEPVGSCDSERHSVVLRHTIKAQRRASAVYFISTSSGDMEGLAERRLGLCLEKNMRLSVNLGAPQLGPVQDALYGLEVDVGRLETENLYLAEENGDLNWKKNVHPAIERELDRDLVEKRMKFDKSRQMEPIPIDDEFVNRLEEYRMRSTQEDFNFPADVKVLHPMNTGAAILYAALPALLILQLQHVL